MKLEAVFLSSVFVFLAAQMVYMVQIVLVLEVSFTQELVVVVRFEGLA